jgi:hypothetical protein
MPHPVVHWEIGAANAKRSQEFFAKLFDWKIDANNPLNYGMVDTGGGGINGGICDAPKGVPYFVMYIQVDDLQQYLDKAASLGGQAVVPPTIIPCVGVYAFFKDPDGNIIGLFKSN